MHQENLSMKMSKQFPLNALRVFEAAARLGSFTKAGNELGMTQTAVSYQIKLIEESVGEPLFLRRPRQIALTEVGQRLAPKVTEAFELMQEAGRLRARRCSVHPAHQFDRDLRLAMARPPYRHVPTRPAQHGPSGCRRMMR
jgi:DNA-binding transcriptional LysR family regulator